MKKNGRIFVFTLIAFVFLFFVSRSITGRLYKDYKTIFPTYTTYRKTKVVKGYNIFKEKVYKAEGSGITIFNASEGQKVPVGFEVASINLMNDTSGLKDDLIKVNAALSYKTQGISEEEVDTDNNLSLKELQNDLKNKNLSKAIADINDLDISSQKSVSISELSELLDYSKEALEARKKELLEQISRSNITYKSENSAVVSFLIDNLENKYKPEDLDKFTYNYLIKNSQIRENKTVTRIEKDDPLFKLIENDNYYIALAVESLKDVGDPKVGDYLTIEFDKNNMAKSKIVKINNSDSGSVIILFIDDLFDAVYKKRINDFNLILREEKCFEIPKSTIVKRDDLFGVYVQEIHGLVRFVPIKVIHPLDNSSYISKGDKNSYITISNKRYRTISINDSIVLNPKQVNESEVLN